MERLSRRISAVLALLCLATVYGTWPGRAAETFDIDVVLPLTGAGAFLGSAEQRALQQFEKHLGPGGVVGNMPVRFVFHDDQSSPQVAVQLASQIAGSKPAVVLGSALVGMCNAMAPMMRRGPVMYCFSPGIYPASGGYVFSSSVATSELAAAQLRYFHARGWDKVAVITSTDASGLDAQKHIREGAALPENKGLQIVAETTFNPSDLSAAAQVQRMKSAGPDAVIAWSTGAAIGTVFKAIVDAGLDVPVATTDGNMTYAQMRQYADILPKQLFIPSPDWLRAALGGDAGSEAKQRFFAAFDGTDPPDAASTYAWDPALLVVSALQKLGPKTNAEQLRAYLAELTGFSGINGAYDFVKYPQRGLGDENVVVTRWDPAAKTWTVVSKPRGIPLP